MRSLYYKSLDSHMRNYRKGQNMQEMNDQLHQIDLKEELNRELNKENAILNPIAADLKRQEITNKYKEHLDQFKEQKLRRKAENKAKLEILKEEAKTRLQNKKLPIITPAKIKAQNAYKVQSKINHIIPAKVRAQRAHRIKSDIQRDILNEQNPYSIITPHKVKPYRASRIGTKLKNLSYADIVKRTRAPSSATSIQSEGIPMVDLRMYNKGRPTNTGGIPHHESKAAKKRKSATKRILHGGGLKRKMNTLI